MEMPKIFESEYRFCLILWAGETVRGAAWLETDDGLYRDQAPLGARRAEK